MSSSAFETLRDKMKRQLKTRDWGPPPQTIDEQRASLTWCRRFRYELSFLDRGSWGGALAVLLNQRIEQLEQELGPDGDTPF